MNTNRSSFIYLTVLVILVLSLPVGAQIEFSGFFDFIHSYNLTEKENGGFGYGQFEIDPAVDLTEKISAEAALAYNPDDEKLELGAGFVDFHFSNAETEHPAKGKFLTHTGLMIGQFDVPFGIDYLSIPSPDRLLVSTPLLNEKTINSWNDIGLNLYGQLGNSEAAIYLVNGFTGGVALGGRLGFGVGEFLTAGVSYSGDFKSVGSPEASVFGIDFTTEMKAAALKFEYQSASGLVDGNLDSLTSDNTHSGYYLEVDHDLEQWLGKPVFTVFRYGTWNSVADRDQNGTDDKENRLTFGLGYRLNEVLEFRLEYLSNTIEKNDAEQQLTIQTVVSF